MHEEEKWGKDEWFDNVSVFDLHSSGFVVFLFEFFCLNFKLIEKWMIWRDVFAYGDEEKKCFERKWNGK